MGDPATVIASTIISAGISYLAYKMAEPDEDDGLIGDTPLTLSSRGSYLPLLIGRQKLGGILLDETTRRIVEENTSQTGGKGAGAGGAGNGQKVVYSRLLVGLCVGPARRLRSIEMNGERIWPLEGTFPAGITPDTHPSGSRLTLGGDPAAGSVVIYWGEGDQPFNAGMIGNGYPVASRLPFVCYAFFDELRLGSQGTVPSLNFDIEAAPYKPANTFGSSYLPLPFTLGGSNGWFRNGRVFDPLATYPALIYDESAGTIKLAGDARSTLGVGEPFVLRYASQTGVLGTSLGVSYNPTETISVPVGLSIQQAARTPRLVQTALVSPDWTLLNASVTRQFSPWDIPGFGAGANLNDVGVYTVTPSPGVADWRVTFRPDEGTVTPPGGVDFRSFGNQRNEVRMYIRVPDIAQTPLPPSMALVFYREGGPFNAFTSNTKAIIRVLSGRRLSVTSEPFYGINSSIEAIGNDWYQLVVSCDTGQNNNLNADDPMRIVLTGLEDPTFNIPAYTGTFEFGFGRGNKPLIADPMLTYLDSDIIVGVSTLTTSLPLAGYQNFTGEVGSYILDPEGGDHGANAAHIIYQLLFETWPHGLGMDPGLFDIDSLQEVGVEMETEGLRCHTFIENGGTISDAVAAVMGEVGIQCAWDHTTGKFAFRLERATAPDSAVPFHSIIQAPLGSTRVFDAGRGDLLSYEFTSAMENYVTHSLDVDRQGAQTLASGGAVRTTRIQSTRDIEAGQRVASILANLDFSQASLKSFRMGRDGIVVRPGDILDFTAWTRTPQNWRVVSVKGAPHTPEVEVSAYEDRLDYGTPSISGLRLLEPGEDPNPPAADQAVWALESGDSLFVARLPAHPEMAYAEVLGSNDGSTFWKLGSIGYVAGGRVVDDIGTELWLRTSDPEAVAALLRIPEDASSAEVLRGTTTDERGWAFAGAEDLGRGLWRIYGLPGTRTAIDVEAEPDKYVFLWIDGTLPSVSGALPVGESRAYRVEARKRLSPVQIKAVDAFLEDTPVFDGGGA